MGRPTIFSPEESLARCRARTSAWVKNNKAHIAKYDHTRYEARQHRIADSQRVTLTGNTLTHLCL